MPLANWYRGRLHPRSATVVLIAAFCCCSTASATVADDPPVKLSRNGICHERGTSAYGATLHYEPFATLADCIKAGGRAPKTKHAPTTHVRSPPATADRWRANGVFIWRELLRPLAPYFVFGAATALLWRAAVLIRKIAAFIRKRLRARAERRRYKKQEEEAERRWRAHRRERTDTARRIPRILWRASSDERELLAACMNDREAAERLIEYEIEHDSTLTHEGAVTAALQRYRRDNA